MRCIPIFKSYFLLFCLLCVNSVALAQSKWVQKINGSVIDRSVKTPLKGATIELLSGQKSTTVADYSGNFIISSVPVGIHSLRISYIGYKTITLSNLSIESGKEFSIIVEMDENISTDKEIIVKSRVNKSKPLNDLAIVSSRMFSVDETRHFAAGLNDPSRIATAFAGVNNNSDGNGLIIRGNSPRGLLWRLEGVDVPNPNHFARVGTSGGAISILSAQLLANSDFMTGAFPAEYGNAMAGVFDIHLRKGNKNKREHTFSINTIGVDAAAEGYFKKGYGGSYLINYRYAFLTLMQNIGFDISNAPTTFQDLSFNIHLPTKKLGNFSIFGFGGISQQKATPLSDSISWTNTPSSRRGSLDASHTGALGLTHTLNIGKSTFIKSILSLNGYKYKEEDSRYDKINGPLVFTRKNAFDESNVVVSVVATHKFNTHHLIKAGMYTSARSFGLIQRETVNNILTNKIKANGDTRLTNYFTQWKWSPNNKLSVQLGLHGQYFALNNTSIVEPRIGFKYAIGNNQSLSFGYGIHGQIQPIGYYFARIKIGTDTLQPNMGLDFSKATHVVLGYNIQFAPNWNLKAEWYMQQLNNIPIAAAKINSYSVINLEDNFSIETLANKGKGKNNGLEFTLERYWNDQFYLMGTLSVYNSTYVASDNIWRNTRFNANNAWTFVMGKEWTLKTKRPSTFMVNVKTVHTGGVRVTPIDMAQSVLKKTTILYSNAIYGEKLAPFFRIDLQTEWKNQYQKRTGTLVFGVQNLTNRKNQVSQYYDDATKSIKYNYLLKLIPVLGYKIDL